MKFEKYLQNTEISEWRKAYVDYRGLKRLIKAIEFSQKDHDVHPSDIKVSIQLFSSIAGPRSSEVGPDADERSLECSSVNYSGKTLSVQPLSGFGSEHRISASVSSVDPRGSMQACLYDTSSRSGLCRGLCLTNNSDTDFMDPSAMLPLHKIITQLTPQELAFFSMIDAQLDKVESFYLAREKEMVARSFVLLNQLQDLKDHRDAFETHAKKGWTSSIRIRPLRTPSKKSEDSEGRVFKTTAMGDRCSAVDSSSKSERPHLFMSADDPTSYIRANRKLKKAVLEHYRGLESLHNYRVLNITGFRKAVKKFEKITKIPVQKQYMVEKVGNCAFASDDGVVRNMTREMEEIYTAVFARGDGKKACKQLRAKATFKSYHFSAFRSGLLFGFAIFALIDGLLKARQPETQQAIPCWDILLFLYGLMFVPVLYSFLLGMNLVVWARSRINYIFIFDLNSNRLDYRQYFEMPSLLLATLCFAFWASFSRLGSPTLQFTTWPLLWLSFAILILVHPIPVMAKSSRYWFIKNSLKLFLAGMRPVKFADFWMGDQLCSFIFTISNAPLFICVYLDNFSDDWQKCKNSSRTWPIAFGLSSIPFIIRLGQCVKRYFGSKQVTHLINAAKYGTGIVSYLFYFMWSYEQESRGAIFALWCFFNTCYSIYACSWDFLVDFSFLQSHSKHLFLRTELMYTHQWVYYFAMLSNLLVRFIWVIYIPQAGPPMMVRTFITGMFEMLRRIQWNFYRLETEHIGNMDQYRVNREMPLPYANTFDFEIRGENRNTLTEKC